MEKIHVTCDACERDLTYTSNSEEWRIVLSNEAIPNTPGCYMLTAANRPPLLERTYHFCGKRCLSEWLKKELK